VLPVLLLLAPLPRLPRAPTTPAPRAALTTHLALVVRTASGETRAATPGVPPPTRPPVGELKAGEKPEIRWSVRNGSAKAAVRRVVVHFTVRRVVEGAPAREARALVNSVLGTDLSPGASVTGSCRNALPAAGAYQAVIELTDGAGARLQHCAIDLRVTDR